MFAMNVPPVAVVSEQEKAKTGIGFRDTEGRSA
jgi:hypothetical protein